MGEITIREAREGDIERILAIAERGWNSAYAEFLSQETIDSAMTEWYDPDDVREYIRRSDTEYLVAEFDGNIVGYLNGGPTEKEHLASLWAIYVDPDYWGNGIGTTLLTEFEAFCRRESYDRIRIRVLAENAVGTAFYEKRGYEVIEERETTVFGEETCEVIYTGTVDSKSDPA